MKPDYDAFTVKELPAADDVPRKLWRKIGAAWEHRDGRGISIQLDLIPVQFDGRLVLRAPEVAGLPEEEEPRDDDFFEDEDGLPF